MATVSLIGNTGIGGVNYIAFPGIGKNKQGVDSYFQPLIFDTVNDVSEVYFESDANHRNSACIHIPLSYTRLMSNGIDYVKVVNSTIWDDYDRTFYLLVTKVEQVNPNSCRVYYYVDWAASFWDQLEIQESQITRRLERDSSSEDTYDQEYSNHLPEPVDAPTVPYKMNIIQGDGTDTGQTLEELCWSLTLYNSVCVVTMCNQQGKLDNPNFVYQCGGSLGGYAYCFNEGEGETDIENFLKGQVSFSRAMFRWGNPTLSTVTAAYVLPQFCVANGRNTDPEDATNNARGDVDNFWDNLPGFTKYDKYRPITANALIKMLNLETLNTSHGLNLKTKKIMNYVTYTLSSSTNKVDFSPFSINDIHHEEGQHLGQFTRWRPYANMYFNFTGSASGKMQVGIRTRGFSDDSQISGIQVSSPTWPAIFIAGSVTGGLKLGIPGVEGNGG